MKTFLTLELQWTALVSQEIYTSIYILHLQPVSIVSLVIISQTAFFFGHAEGFEIEWLLYTINIKSENFEI